MAQGTSKVRTFTTFLGQEGVWFAFRICFKAEELDGVYLQDFWMDTRTLYGQRGRTAPNLVTIADYFWRRCGLEGTYVQAPMQETYLLARLCPYVRGTAAQRILADARLSRPGNANAARRREAAELEPILASNERMPRRRDRQMTMRQFYRKTADLLGMPRWTKAEVAAYEELSAELFAGAREVLVERGTAAADMVLRRWRDMTRRIGRRSGPAVQLKKRAMDMLSYEAKAAVHRCYSCVWNDLIPHYLHQCKLPAQSVRFLHLMHQERICASTTPGAAFHLFHGHIFALHPAMSLLMLTPTGRRIVREYVLAETAERQLGPFQRLLRAIYTSLYFYTNCRQARRTKGRDEGEAGIEALAERAISRRSGKRRARPKRGDY